MTNDSALKKIMVYGKWKDIFDFKYLECKAALIGSLIIVFFLNFSINENSIENINTIFVALTKDIAISLIGFLGFTVAGLAILTGVVSKSVVQKIVENNKKENLEKILLSFYFLGMIIAIDILGLLCLYILSMSEKEYYLGLVLITSYIFSYMTIFVIFYSVKLVGNCLEIFFIINESGEEKKTVSLKEVYNSYRVTALEKICLSNQDKKIIEEYMKTIFEQIEENEDSILKDRLKKMFFTHFGIKE